MKQNRFIWQNPNQRLSFVKQNPPTNKKLPTKFQHNRSNRFKAYMFQTNQQTKRIIQTSHRVALVELQSAIFCAKTSPFKGIS